MPENTKRAFIIKNPSSPYISEAIIFLNENINAKEDVLIAEAERIINSYLKGNQFISDLKFSAATEANNLCRHTQPKTLKQKKHRSHKAALFCLVSAIVLLCVFSAIRHISI